MISVFVVVEARWHCTCNCASELNHTNGCCNVATCTCTATTNIAIVVLESKNDFARYEGLAYLSADCNMQPSYLGLGLWHVAHGHDRDR